MGLDATWYEFDEPAWPSTPFSPIVKQSVSNATPDDCPIGACFGDANSSLSWSVEQDVDHDYLSMPSDDEEESVTSSRDERDKLAAVTPTVNATSVESTSRESTRPSTPDDASCQDSRPGTPARDISRRAMVLFGLKLAVQHDKAILKNMVKSLSPAEEPTRQEVANLSPNPNPNPDSNVNPSPYHYPTLTLTQVAHFIDETRPLSAASLTQLKKNDEMMLEVMVATFEQPGTRTRAVKRKAPLPTRRQMPPNLRQPSLVQPRSLSPPAPAPAPALSQRHAMPVPPVMRPMAMPPNLRQPSLVQPRPLSTLASAPAPAPAPFQQYAVPVPPGMPVAMQLQPAVPPKMQPSALPKWQLSALPTMQPNMQPTMQPNMQFAPAALSTRSQHHEVAWPDRHWGPSGRTNPNPALTPNWGMSGSMMSNAGAIDVALLEADARAEAPEAVQALWTVGSAALGATRETEQRHRAQPAPPAPPARPKPSAATAPGATRVIEQAAQAAEALPWCMQPRCMQPNMHSSTSALEQAAQAARAVELSKKTVLAKAVITSIPINADAR